MKRRGFVVVALGVGAFLMIAAMLLGRSVDGACPTAGQGYVGLPASASSFRPLPTVDTVAVMGVDTASASGSVIARTPSAAPAIAAEGPAVDAESFVTEAPSLSPAVPPGATVPPVSTAALRFGAATAGGPLAGAEWDQLSLLAGESPSTIMFYQDFLQPPPIAELDAVRARGAVPLVTWEPWSWGGGVEQPVYTLDRIAAGDFDAHLTRWGQALASWGSPVELRFAHEMNGNWYPWAEGVNGNQSGDYVRAWRHVHDVIAATGASNVSWVWSPNIPHEGSTDLKGLYPGAGYVDVVALDGYNWGGSGSCDGWKSPQDLFDPGLAQLRSLAPGVPILIAETASSEDGGSKAKWNTELVPYLAAQPDVAGFVWFHLEKEENWRIDSSAASAAAFREALQSRRTP